VLCCVSQRFSEWEVTEHRSQRSAQQLPEAASLSLSLSLIAAPRAPVKPPSRHCAFRTAAAFLSLGCPFKFGSLGQAKELSPSGVLKSSDADATLGQLGDLAKPQFLSLYQVEEW
jgi:hypothetical protein